MAARKPKRPKRPSPALKPVKARAPASRAKPRAAKPAPRARRSAAPSAAKRAARAAKSAAAEIPGAIGAWHQHLDYTSHDVAAVKRFYTGLLGFRVAMEDPGSGYVSIRTGASSTLGFMPPMPGPPEQWRPPGEPALYFFVENVDRVHRDLLAKGLEFQQAPTDMPWGHRMAICKDPEGRMVCLAQEIKR